MSEPIAIYEPFSVVVVPFPFTDRDASKRRPALVLSSAAVFNTPSGHVVLAMITSQRLPVWPLDVDVADLKRSGLAVPSTIRFKLFTLDQRLILRTAGTLGFADRRRVTQAMKRLFENV
jgi:mRNA interferase MazF